MASRRFAKAGVVGGNDDLIVIEVTCRQSPSLDRPDTRHQIAMVSTPVSAKRGRCRSNPGVVTVRRPVHGPGGTVQLQAAARQGVIRSPRKRAPQHTNTGSEVSRHDDRLAGVKGRGAVAPSCYPGEGRGGPGRRASRGFGPRVSTQPMTGWPLRVRERRPVKGAFPILQGAAGRVGEAAGVVQAGVKGHQRRGHLPDVNREIRVEAALAVLL